MPQFEQVQIIGVDGKSLPMTPQSGDDDPTSRRDFLREAIVVASAGAIGTAATGQARMNDGVLSPDTLAREQQVHAQGFELGVLAAISAKEAADRAARYTNEQIVIQLTQGKRVLPYFSATVLMGAIRSSTSDARVPLVVHNPIIPGGLIPIIEDDPASFCVLHQNWYPDGRPYFVSYWLGGKGAKIEFSGNPEKVVDVAVCSSGTPGDSLDRVQIVDRGTGQPLEGLAPVGLMSGMPQLSAPADLKYA